MIIITHPEKLIEVGEEMDAHVSLEVLEKFKYLLNQFSTGMSVEAQKMQLHLTKTHQQLEQRHFELKKKLQMCPDQISYEQTRQELIEFERLFAGFCQAAQECIKGFQQQELMVANRQKAVTIIDQKVGVLREYLGTKSISSGSDQGSQDSVISKGIRTIIHISDTKMYQLGKHFNKHGRDMGFSSKKEYEAAARLFANTHQSNSNAKVLEGVWNGKGPFTGTIQRAIVYDGKTVILDKQTGQIVDFYIGSELRGLIHIKEI